MVSTSMVDLRSVLSRLYADMSRPHSASERFGITVFLQRNIFKQFNQKQTLPLLLLQSTTGAALAFAAPVSRENGSTAANQQRY